MTLEQWGSLLKIKGSHLQNHELRIIAFTSGDILRALMAATPINMDELGGAGRGGGGVSQWGFPTCDSVPQQLVPFLTVSFLVGRETPY